MKYIDFFEFPDAEVEFDFFNTLKRTVYDSFYPFQILTKHRFERIDFEPITILYGGNGSGKTTVLNVIAEKINSQRESNFNKSSFFNIYLDLCNMNFEENVPSVRRVITSDDVFEYVLNVRMLNDGIDTKREDLFEEYTHNKYAHFQFNSLDDYEQLKKVNHARGNTQSKYVRNELMDNVREYSNGESAFRYFTENIEENGLYLLDEPENSLSPKRQLELVQFLEDSVRFFGCQFVISTHSPFLLAMKDAKIYDMDSNPVDVRKWTELENSRVYYEFFQKHKNEFD